MLDHLSYGRLEVGVGRGVSPFELKYHKVEHDESREIFIDAFNCISAGPDHRHAQLYAARTSPIRERADCAAAAAAAASGVLVRLVQHDRLDLGGRAAACISSRSGRCRLAKTNIDAFKAAFAKRGGAGAAQGRVPGRRRDRRAAPYLRRRHRRGGARASASRPWTLHLAQLNWLRAKHGQTGLTSRLNVPRGADFEACVADGTVIAGTPRRCAPRSSGRCPSSASTICSPTCSSATMTLAEALRSLQLFSTEVMPKLRAFVVVVGREGAFGTTARLCCRTRRHRGSHTGGLVGRLDPPYGACDSPGPATTRGNTMTNGRVTGVRSIELGVRDLHQSADFYTKVWALEEVASEGDSIHFRATGGEHHVLTIRERAKPAPARRAFRRGRSRGGRPAARPRPRVTASRSRAIRRRSPAAPAAATASASAPPMVCR